MLRHMPSRLGGVAVRVLVTNDDGADSEGLHRLASVARDAGWEVTVAAPSQEFSGSSAALTAVEEEGRILVERRELPGLAGVPAYAVAASPAFIVVIAARGGFGEPPDVVLSGINLGANAGRAVMHSGTVGAALTAAIDGRPALAVSLQLGTERPDVLHWQTAAAVVAEVLPAVAALPAGVALNLNVPNREYGQLRGLRRGTLASFGTVQLTIAERDEGFLRLGMSDNDAELETGSDEYWLARGYVAVTPLRPVAEAAEVELPLTAEMRGGRTA
jgi:5'-nucleotidase